MFPMLALAASGDEHTTELQWTQNFGDGNSEPVWTLDAVRSGAARKEQAFELKSVKLPRRFS